MAAKRRNFKKSMSTSVMEGDTLAAASKIVNAGGSGGNSRTTSPPVTIGAAAVPSVPTRIVLSTDATPYTKQAWDALVQLSKISKLNRSRSSQLSEKPEVQTLLDKEVFLIQSDRRTKMNPIQQLQLIRVLAQFFLERIDDGHRYAYFEAIFLGRAEDPILHEYRVSVMFQLVSMSLQYPIIQYVNYVMGWLCKMKNEETERFYSDRLIDMVVDHFVRPSNDRNESYKFLIPLVDTCCEFCTLFVSRAPLHCSLNPSLIELLTKYTAKHMQYILKHLRDTPWLGNDFADKVIPKLVEYVLMDETADSDSLGSCIVFILFRWNEDVLATSERKGPTTRIEVLDMLLSSEYTWSQRRACILASAIQSSNRCPLAIRKHVREAEVPPEYKEVIDFLCAEDQKNNVEKVIEMITNMNVDRNK